MRLITIVALFAALACLGCRDERAAEPIAAKPAELPIEQPIETKHTIKEVTSTIGLKLLYIPPGTFVMGAPESEEGAKAYERPQHHVDITKGFYLGRTEVTQAEYQAVIGNNPSWFCAAGGGSAAVRGLDTSRFPVEQVTWDEAREFCFQLTKKEQQAGKLRPGEAYRLPTEAEWEYACRGGAKSYQLVHYGNAMSSKQANFPGSLIYGDAEEGPSLGRTTDVGSYQPNAFGLFDMHGNVAEWCADWFDDKAYRRGNCKDPSGPATGLAAFGPARVVRGGDWKEPLAWCCRSAARDWMSPGGRQPHLGFRVARTAVD